MSLFARGDKAHVSGAGMEACAAQADRCQFICWTTSVLQWDFYLCCPQHLKMKLREIQELYLASAFMIFI